MPIEINRACLEASPSCIQAHSWLALGSKSAKFAQMPNNCDCTLRVTVTPVEYQAHSGHSSWCWPGKECMDVVVAVAPTRDMWAQQPAQLPLTSPFGQCPVGVQRPALPGTVLSSPCFPKGYSTQLALRFRYH